MTMGNVAEQCLPSLTRTLLVWHESQLSNLNFLKQQQQQQLQSDASSFSTMANTKTNLKSKQQLLTQAKM
jgi:hypothetical protein